ncbi:MAG: pyrroloquinoline quinone biosynthesis protein PqqE [Pseudonocardia sp.]|nr:pyrroloquinoline quinone biosynthesis protein PqqE [Pseudonocardia sp.]
MPGATPEPPLGMLAELTHRCPLQCGYCSNPLELVGRAEELNTAQWCDVISQARELGVLQLHLSGGEPLQRPDLAEIVRHARREDCYVNLVTSGFGLTPERGGQLADAGVEHVQLSLQDADELAADAVAGATGAHRRKRAAADVITALGLPLTINVVLHRGNVDRIPDIVELAEAMGADRLELAHTQYYGWALRNRVRLMPTAAQLSAAEAAVAEARARSSNLRIGYVPADYHETYPKPCMHGWAARQLTVAPNGVALPCPAASVIDSLPVVNVRDTSLRSIWYEAESFQAFRGTSWMREPCVSCARRQLDFGGCRCQAFQLTGDPTHADPVCSLSPHRHLIDELVANAELGQALYLEPRRMRSAAAPR